MSTRKLSNISLKDLRKFLTSQGLNIVKDTKGRGGHEKWSKSGIERPITIQTHIRVYCKTNSTSSGYDPK